MRERPLPGIGDAPAGGARNLFFALCPGEGTRDAIAAQAERLKRGHAPRGRWIKPHRYHLTLHFLGTHAHLPDALVAAALAAGDEVRASPFEFALDRAGSFANRSIPWWLGCARPDAGLAMLHDGIAAALRAGGRRIRNGKRLVAHVTVLRDADRALPPTPIEPISWPVAEFVLIDSLLGEQASHAVLRRWPLRA
ncbi:MAG TPA: RNA 2',3'-cyclic phosphodiesterase [Rhodanobacteraceae bacterium]|nr:RNA 2',3'-cyclic phosphodiesterase [Rhodanobacteraceae bacterium]